MGRISRTCIGLALLTMAGCEPSKPSAPLAAQHVEQPSQADRSLNWSPESTDQFELEPEFRRLQIDDFASFPEKPSAFTGFPGGRLLCTGRPRGYVYTREEFSDFELRGEFRYSIEYVESVPEFPGNAGFLLWITGPHKVWPKSIEVQGKYTQFFTVKENGGAKAPVLHDDEKVRLAARKHPQEWQTFQIIGRQGAIEATLNGTLVCRSEPSDVDRGPIGLQSEGHSYELRRLRIRSLSEAAPTESATPPANAPKAE